MNKVGVIALCIVASAADAQQSAELEEVVVTGYRGSLQNATEAKRESIGFVDEIFADDLGKMPSQNLAESLNRIPGVRIGREVTGEGLQISVRGLGPSFTRVVLNGNNIALASDGGLGAGNRNREVDLGVFPTELFTRLSVSKSAEANQLEGGISGYVDMRTARAFDTDGRRVDFSLEGAYNEINEEVSPKGSFIYSDTFADNTFGFLFGLATTRNKSRVDGYETVGYLDGCLVDVSPADGSYACQAGSIGRNLVDWNPRATADYAATHPGVNVGDPIDVPVVAGATAAELDQALVPYLGRGALVEGDRDTTTGLISFEFRPSDDMSFALDLMSSTSDREFNRIDMMLWMRRATGPINAPIAEDFVADSSGVLRSATFYNTQFWIEARDYNEKLEYTSVMPSFSWNISDTWSLDISASHTESTFDREEPTWLFTTPKGISTYALPAGNDVPSFSFTVPGSSFELNGTEGWFFGGGGGTGGARLSINERETETNGLHANAAWGEDAERNGIRFGLSYDESDRFMETRGADANHNTAVQALTLNDYLVPMSSDFGEDMNGNLGYNRFILLDYDAIKSAYDYQGVVNSATRGGGDQFGQTVGDIEETYTAVYIERNKMFLDDKLQTKLGIRYVATDQTLASFDATNNLDAFSESDYNDFLPSFNAVYQASDELIFRASASRTMTRPNPADMFPNAAWTSSGINTARAGNPFLEPFYSDNLDIGGEWYFGELGYVGLSIFRKKVDGFTYQQVEDVIYQDLAAYGLDLTDIGDDREAQLAACGGPAVCTVSLTTRLNVDGSAMLTGEELIWVQPLDNLLNGLGFNASITHMDQFASNPLAEVTDIPEIIYSFTGFYENNDFQVRMTYYHQDDAVASGFLDGNYDGDPLPARRRISLERSQVDLAMSYKLPLNLGENGGLTLTFDGYNLTNEAVGSWYGQEGLPENIYFPGATYTVGIRGSL
jgi:TonB-dependent receptor